MSAKSREVAIDDWAVLSFLIEDARQKRARPEEQLVPDKPVVAADTDVTQSPGTETLPDSTVKLTMTDLHGTRGDAESQVAENKSNKQLPLAPSDTEEEDEQPQPKIANVKTDIALGSGQLLHDGAKPEKLATRGAADSGTKHCDMKLKSNDIPKLQKSTTELQNIFRNE